MLCPDCRNQGERVISAPALVHVRRGWDERANEDRRNPHTQAKAQLTNMAREQAERTGTTPKVPTEEQIQVGAREIAKRPREDVEMRHAKRLLAEKRRMKATNE